MCSPIAAFAGLQMLSAMKEGKAAEGAANFNAATDERNAMLADMGAQDAVARGAVQAGQVRTSTSRLIGKQRTSYAASGVDVASGSALDVYASTRGTGELDAATVENNAARDAFGLKMRAQDFRTQAALRRMAGRQARTRMLITGVTRAASMFAGGGGGGGSPGGAGYTPSYSDYAGISD